MLIPVSEIVSLRGIWNISAINKLTDLDGNLISINAGGSKTLLEF